MKPTKAPFIQQVKDALSHLHDHAYLQLHPLATTLAAGDQCSLHDRLCAEIEQLQPPAHLPRAYPSWRSYLSLHLRYVEGLEIAAVAEALALTERQGRREHQKGLHALADRLQQQLREDQAVPELAHTRSAPFAATQQSATEAATGYGALEMEIERLGTAGEDSGKTAVGAVLPGVLDTMADFAAQRNVGIHTRWHRICRSCTWSGWCCARCCSTPWPIC